ncbi:MAG: hypothetical protein AMXMBFR33_31720 [Candidatus Xenobia bacterium]
MPSKSDIKKSRQTVSCRLGLSVYTRAVALADKRKVSLNSLLNEALLQLLKQSDEAMLVEGFEQLADDSDVEFAHAAQAEVVLGKES